MHRPTRHLAQLMHRNPQIPKSQLPLFLLQYSRRSHYLALSVAHYGVPGAFGGKHSIYPVGTDQHNVIHGFALGAFPVLWFGFFKRNSASLLNKKQDFAGAMSLHLIGPSSFIPSSDVLFQVRAVGPEGLDRQIMTDKLAAGDAG